MKNRDAQTGLILSFHRALLGAITDNLYAVAAWISDDEKHLRVVGYYTGDPHADDERFQLSAAVAEVIADYTDIVLDEERYVDVGVEPLPKLAAHELMFLRHARGTTAG